MNLIELLGRKPSDRVVIRFVATLGEQPEVEASDDTMCLEFRNSGITLLFIGEERLAAITAFADAVDDDFAAFAGELPHGLELADTQEQVRRRLGTPSESVEGGNYPILGWVAARDVFWLPNHSVHVEYLADGKGVAQVTVMTVEDSPGREAEE